MWRKIESTKNISSAKQTGWMLEISSKCRPFCCYLFQYAQKKHEPTSTDKQLLHLHRRHSVVAGLQSHHLATTNRWTATRGQHGPAQALVAEQVRVGLDPVSRPRLRIHPSASPRVKHYLGLLADERKDLLNVVATWSKERLYTQMLVLCHKSKNHI